MRVRNELENRGLSTGGEEPTFEKRGRDSGFGLCDDFPELKRIRAVSWLVTTRSIVSKEFLFRIRDASPRDSQAAAKDAAALARRVKDSAGPKAPSRPNPLVCVCLFPNGLVCKGTRGVDDASRQQATPPGSNSSSSDTTVRRCCNSRHPPSARSTPGYAASTSRSEPCARTWQRRARVNNESPCPSHARATHRPRGNPRKDFLSLSLDVAPDLGDFPPCVVMM